MSAVTPHLEQQDDPSVTEEERAWFKATVVEREQGADAIGELNPPMEVQRAALEQRLERPRPPEPPPPVRPVAPAPPPPAPAPLPSAPEPAAEMEAGAAAIDWVETHGEWPPQELLEALSDEGFQELSEYVAAAHPELIDEDEDYDEDFGYEEAAGLARRRRRRALGATVVQPGAAFARRAQQASHARLLRTGWTRRAIEEALVGRELTVLLGSDLPKGKRPSSVGPNDVVLQLDEPIHDPVFNAPGTGVRNIPLLSWTSKMVCPSFSLPAGPPTFGGSCPGADGGQTIVPQRALRRAQLPVIEVQGPVDTMETVCQWCYAEGGNYRFGSNQLNQVVRLVWARQAVRNGSFHEVMSWAVEHADYRSDGDSTVAAERFVYADGELAGEPIRFFRIHDSGDFFNKDYLAAWVAVARQHPDVQFWAPSRIWARPELGAHVRRYSPPANLVIRPSSYMVDRPADDGLWSLQKQGFAGPTTVYTRTAKSVADFNPDGLPYHWDCQAYASRGEDHSCRSAKSPPPEAGGDGGTGCRACWLHPGLSVNYTKH